jgi:hypothetical protein
MRWNYGSYPLPASSKEEEREREGEERNRKDLKWNCF